MHKILWDFEIQTDHPISSRRKDRVLINKKKRTCQLMGFAIPTEHEVKIKENEKTDKYLDLTREQKKMRNMKETVIPIVVGTLGTVHKGLEKRVGRLETRSRIDTIQTIALLKSGRIFRRVQETCCHSDSCEKQPVKTDVKNSPKI